MNNNPGTLNWTRQLLESHDLNPRKQLGQNFLVDRNILEKIMVAADLTGDDTVVEIGTGLGALTIYLAQRAKKVITVEIDRSLAPIHREVFAPFPNIKKVEADILKTDIEGLVGAQGGGPPYKVCANLPYYITTPVIFQLLEKCPHLESAVLMVQKEVAERIVADPGSKTYGLLTVMAAYYARWEMVGRVRSSCFWPRPEVESALIKMVPRLPEERLPVGDLQVFHRLLRAVFNQRRKMMVNTLAADFGLEKDEVKIRLRRVGINEQARPEDLTVEQLGRLAQEFA